MLRVRKNVKGRELMATLGLKSYGRALLDEGEDAAFVGDGDIRATVVIQIGDDELRAHAGIVVDEVRGVSDGFSDRVAREFEPINDGGGVGLGVAFGAVRPVAFTGDDIEEPVAVDVGEDGGVRLGELDTSEFFGGVAAEDGVFAPRGLGGASGGGELLEPAHAVFVGFDARDDVGTAVTIDVVNIHLGAAAAEIGGWNFHKGSPASEAGCSHQPL